MNLVPRRKSIQQALLMRELGMNSYTGNLFSNLHELMQGYLVSIARCGFLPLWQVERGDDKFSEVLGVCERNDIIARTWNGGHLMRHINSERKR